VRNTYRWDVVKEMHRLVKTSRDTGKFSEDDLFIHYQRVFGNSVTSLDDNTIGGIAESLLDRVGASLRVADVFIAAPVMHRAVIAATCIVNGDDVATMTRGDVEWENGVLVFPQTVHIDEPRGQASADAISWQIVSDENGHPELCTQYWTRWSDIPGQWQDSGLVAKFRPSTIQMPLDQSHTGDTVPVAPGHMRDDALDPSWSPDSESAESGPEDDYSWTTNDSAEAMIAGYLFSFLRIASQPIVTVHRCVEGKREGGNSKEWEGVHVAQLRRSNEGTDGQPHSVNWQHSWVVRMHKVRQWYPSEGRHKVLFRGPYMKGPADAPLLINEKVHALVR
jgi:hypothetical protein